MDNESTLPQQVRDWLGQVVVVQSSGITVEKGAWENFCVAVEDANPLYWSEAAAEALGTELFAPPAQLSAWARPHPWSPFEGEEEAPRPLELHHRLKALLDYPLGIVREVECRFLVPLRAGDTLRAEQILTQVGPQYSNRLGTGRDWTITVNYRRADDVLVGQEINQLFGYRRTEPH